jgi:hypothetical protein
MINADHIGMCKFKSDDDAAYQVVEGDIKSMVRGVVSRLEQKQG